MFSYVFMKILEARPHSYDRLMDRVSRGRMQAVREAVAAEIPAGARVLEIGCGTGKLAEVIAGLGATVQGFDFSPAMIAAARDRIEKHGLAERFMVREMGVDGMDGLPSAGFDTVVSTLVLSEVSEDERRFALKQAARVLRPGGLIVIADEVVPRSCPRRVLQAVARVPLAALTYLVAEGMSRPIANITGELSEAGFIVEKETRSHGDAFALVVAYTPKKEESRCHS
jgi:demethylmenaquinone methyltransferase/2-methoxy-6-polyprenyl-1,4-benzoquinol methylase